MTSIHSVTVFIMIYNGYFCVWSFANFCAILSDLLRSNTPNGMDKYKTCFFPWSHQIDYLTGKEGRVSSFLCDEIDGILFWKKLDWQDAPKKRKKAWSKWCWQAIHTYITTRDLSIYLDLCLSFRPVEVWKYAPTRCPYSRGERVGTSLFSSLLSPPNLRSSVG